MPLFQMGDQVRCIDSERSDLTFGKRYEVKKTRWLKNRRQLLVEDDHGDDSWYFEIRFCAPQDWRI